MVNADWIRNALFTIHCLLFTVHLLTVLCKNTPNFAIKNIDINTNIINAPEGTLSV